MDKLTHYQQVIIDFLKARAKHKPANLPDIDAHVIVDKENNHFQLLQLGWQGQEYIFTVVFHLDIKEGKIWLQQNITEHEVVDVLMDNGIPKEDIVLGLQPPYARSYLGFATA